MDLIEILSDSKLWRLDKKPELAGYNPWFQDEIEKEHRQFAETMKVFSKGSLSYYIVVPDEWESDFRRIYLLITGQLPGKYNVQIDKQSVSIKITLKDSKFKSKMNDTLPYQAFFEKHNKSWTCNNVRFGFYLIKMFGI
jgi:hypothetical protein